MAEWPCSLPLVVNRWLEPERRSLVLWPFHSRKLWIHQRCRFDILWTQPEFLTSLVVIVAAVGESVRYVPISGSRCPTTSLFGGFAGQDIFMIESHNPLRLSAKTVQVQTNIPNQYKSALKKKNAFYHSFGTHCRSTSLFTFHLRSFFLLLGSPLQHSVPAVPC